MYKQSEQINGILQFVKENRIGKMHFSLRRDNLFDRKKDKLDKDSKIPKSSKPVQELSHPNKENYHHTQYLNHHHPIKHKQMKISHNTVNLTLNEVHFDQSQLLDSLLFSNEKQSLHNNSLCEDDELLLSDYKQSYSSNFQTPTQKFAEPTVFRSQTNECQFFVYSPVFVHQNGDNGVLWRRLRSCFGSKTNLIDFYIFISGSQNELSLQMSIRSFLFQNGIIFNKQELSEFVNKMKISSYSPAQIGKRIKELFMEIKCEGEQKFTVGDRKIRSDLAYYDHNVWEMIISLKGEERQMKFFRDWASSKLVV